MRNPTDYTEQIKKSCPTWSYDHLIRCNRYIKETTKYEYKNIEACIALYKKTFVDSQLVTTKEINKLTASKEYSIA